MEMEAFEEFEDEFEPRFELPMADFDVIRDELAITYPGLGYALWLPQPQTNHLPVEIGDVGFVWEGNFVRLFNALLPRDHRLMRDSAYQRITNRSSSVSKIISTVGPSLPEFSPRMARHVADQGNGILRSKLKL